MHTSQAQAEQLKAKGNEYFKKDKLGAAIDAYTEAIALCPTVATYWTNRAVCFKKKSEWEKVLEDSRRALELDKNSLKAHKLMGSAHLEMKHYAEAIRSLTRVLDLGAAAGLSADTPALVEAELELSRAKYEEWHLAAAEKRERQSKLRRHLRALLKEDLGKRMAAGRVEEVGRDENGPETTKRMCPSPQARTPISPSPLNACNEDSSTIDRKSEEPEKSPEQSRDVSPGASPCTGPAICEGAGHGAEECGFADVGLEKEYAQMLNTLENVFDAVEAPDVPGEVPEHLCCKITMELFRDPVVTPSGVTYERAVLNEHLQRGRNFDPLTRAPLDPSQVAPNLAMKEAVSSYLELHGWAHQNVFHPLRM